jgi:hypothetical protein
MYPTTRPFKVNARLFWTKVRKTDYCWFWTGPTNVGGYGIQGQKGLAHRISWELTRGPIPTDRDKCFVLHTCDNRRCVNPNHLYLGSKKENGRDTVVRDRYPNRKGENSSQAKLTEADALAIRARFLNGASGSALAREFGVSTGTIYDIGKRKTWTHVGEAG